MLTILDKFIPFQVIKNFIDGRRKAKLI